MLPNPVIPVNEIDGLFSSNLSSSRPNSMHFESTAVQSTGERPASTHGTPTSSELTALPSPFNSPNAPPITSSDEFSSRNRLAFKPAPLFPFHLNYFLGEYLFYKNEYNTEKYFHNYKLVCGMSCNARLRICNKYFYSRKVQNVTKGRQLADASPD